MAIRAALAFGVVLALCAIAGTVWVGSARLGILAGLIAASGAALIAGTERLKSGSIALPPLVAVVGAVFFAIGVIAIARPAAVYAPRWVVQLDASELHDGVRVLSDQGASEGAISMSRAVPLYQDAFADLLGTRETCGVDIVIATDTFEVLARASGREGGEFGSYHTPVFGRPVVLAKVGTGWGSMTHHWMNVSAPCALGPNHPAWVYAGLASLVEKHAPVDGKLSFRFRSDWRVPDSLAVTPALHLQRTLASANQGELRSLFLFLLDRKHLRGFIEKLHAGTPAEVALQECTGMSFAQLEATWRDWHGTSSQQIPILPLASPFGGAAAL